MVLRSSQKGATLIVVLIILVLIVIISVVAIRQSTTSLNIATNAQVQQIMFESSDAGLAYVENIATKASANHRGGIIYSLSKSDVETHNVFCFESQSSNPSLEFSTVVWQNGTLNFVQNGVAGYCKANQFADAKKAVITQVNIKRSATQKSTGLDGYSVGSEVNEKYGIVAPIKVTVYSTSLVPSLSSASQNQINLCLSQHIPQLPDPVEIGLNQLPSGLETIGQCLSNLNVPHYISVAEYIISDSQKNKQDTK